MNNHFKRYGAALTMLALLSWTSLVSADVYPSKPIRFIVGYTAGGIVDNTARVVGERMSRELGQPIIVENRAGANGQIATDLVAKSPADGYTLLVTSVGFAYRQHLVKLPYDPIKDFSPVSLLVVSPLMIVVNQSLPVSSLKELIEYAKKNPGGLRYGTSGTGGPAHLAGELFKSITGIDMVHVPYRGDSAAVIDLLGGNIDLSVSSISATVSYIKAGRLRALTLMTDQSRSPMLPDVPMATEAGVSNLYADSWVGIVAPAGTPAATMQKLYSAAAIALSDRLVREKLIASGNTIVGSRPEDFVKFLRNESDKWQQVISNARIQIDQ